MEKQNSFKAATTIAAPVFLKKDETVDTVGLYARLDVARVLFDPTPRNSLEFQKKEM
jgi:hypothetical protein